MVFLSIALRYLAFCAPLFAVYVLVLRSTGWNPQFVSYGWTAANVVVVGYLIYWGWAVADLSPVRSFLYAVGATFVVLLPLIGILALVVGRGSPPNPETDGDG